MKLNQNANKLLTVLFLFPSVHTSERSITVKPLCGPLNGPAEKNDFEHACSISYTGVNYICDPQLMLSRTHAGSIDQVVVQKNLTGCICNRRIVYDSGLSDVKRRHCNGAQHEGKFTVAVMFAKSIESLPSIQSMGHMRHWPTGKDFDTNCFWSKYPNFVKNYYLHREHHEDLFTLLAKILRSKWEFHPFCQIDLLLVGVNHVDERLPTSAEQVPRIHVSFGTEFPHTIREKVLNTLAAINPIDKPDAVEKMLMFFREVDLSPPSPDNGLGKILGMPMWAFWIICACIILTFLLVLLGHVLTLKSFSELIGGRSTGGGHPPQGKWHAGFAGGLWDM